MEQTETKSWWQSRTIWASIVGVIFPILSFNNLLPPELTSNMVVESIMVITSTLAIIFRVKADKKIVIKDASDESL